MDSMQAELTLLGTHLSGRQDAILRAWQGAVNRDPTLTTSDALPRVQLLDHIPAILRVFVDELRSASGAATPAHAAPGTAASGASTPGAAAAENTIASAEQAGEEPAIAHGLQRWRQGYDLREVTRELGKLNECVIAELDSYAEAHPQVSHAATATARRIWSALASTAVEQSVGQYFELEKREAVGHVQDLETALAEVQRLEEQRAEVWRQAAHDLRGNLGVVANATVALTHTSLQESSREDFVRILMRNVTSLHHLLEDVTSLARLQAGQEQRRIEALDVSPIMQQLCEGIRPLAQQHHLFLRCDGPPGFATEGDAIKIRRIAQNLVLNAVKFTRTGGITVSWGDSDANDPKRWMLVIQDTGPGFPVSGSAPLTSVLSGKFQASATAGAPPPSPPADDIKAGPRAAHEPAGEGIGLSIVKRLCDMLNAAVEAKSEPGVGTTFQIRFPRQYS
jgi:signal transduction histidine kinase